MSFFFQILKEALKYNGSESNPGNQQVRRKFHNDDDDNDGDRSFLILY